jgi:hypothetical protein
MYVVIKPTLSPSDGHTDTDEEAERKGGLTNSQIRKERRGGAFIDSL